MTELRASLNPRGVSLTVPAASHPPHVLHGAAIGFIDRCYVLLDRPSPEQIRVTLTIKDALEEEGALEHLARELEGKLRDSDLFHRVADDNDVLTQAVVAQAFGFGDDASSGPSLDDLDTFDFSDDAFDDPLGIAQTWEAKHAKPKPDAEPQESK